MYTLEIKAQHHAYPLYVAEGLLSNSSLLNQHIKGEQVFIVCDDIVAPLYLEKLLANFPDKNCQFLILPHGEINKTVAVWSKIFDALIKAQFRRSATLIALGGGVIGDMTGFAAACYQRGVDFLQVPTTLLAQVDSSIGGKTAINHPLAKNMVGAFYPPRAVFIDLDTLKTLPKRELAAGCAEIIKHGLIADADFFIWLEKNSKQLLNLETDFLKQAIIRSCEIKAKIVEQDEYEQAQRAYLNFGHTFAHALEAKTNYQTYLHGEAVAIGMVQACLLSEEQRGLPKAITERVISLLSSLDLPVTLPVSCTLPQLVKEMQYDKKANDKGLRFIILNQLGEAAILDDYRLKD